MQRIISVLAIFLSAFQLFAGQETYNTRIEGTDIFVGATHQVYDVKFFEMQANPMWVAGFTNHSVKNTVQLGINPEVVQNGIFTATVVVKVTYQTWNGTAFTTVVKQRTLVVDYDGTDPNTQIDDLSTFAFEGGHLVNVEIVSISPGIDPNAIFLESRIDIERYYTFDGSAVLGSSHDYNYLGINNGYNNGFIEFNWDVKAGAEFYELEWVHINDYTLDDGVYVGINDLKYDFYLNSTRISTHDNWYKIPAIFDHGYVIFRVRAVGAQGVDFLNRHDGEWDGPEKGIVGTFPNGTPASFPNARIILINSQYDIRMNWAHQVGYTEEGKRFEGLSFMDGLGRGRQSVSHNTVTEQAVVSNIYYDELGRPAISDLPTPVDGEQLIHYPNFNRPESNTLVGYGPDYYDDLNAINDPECAQTSAGFSLDYGAGKYYSSENLDIDGENAHIPDAENFPFSRVTYLPDFTNRPRRIGAFGEDLKMGSGHETEMIYVSTNQAELNRLFGSEVGYKEHYQKMITIDANGQAYAQYTDMAGRVVASYLIGPAPANLDPLIDSGGQNVTVDLLVNGDSQWTSYLPPSTTLSHKDYFPTDDVYTFSYGFTPAQYASLCLPENICLDCVYDLTIEIVEECGAVAMTQTIQVNGQTFDAMCDGTAHVTNQAVSLFKGLYTITKTLSVNQDAINEYWCTYIDNSTCLTPLSDHFNAFYADEPFDNCNEYLLADDAIGCDVYKEIMLEDVTPGGQYALYDDNGGVYGFSDQASIDIFQANWQSGTYLNANGSAYTLTTIEDFIDNFRPEWAEYFLQFHPEICHLDFCELSSTSDTYLEGMLDTDEYASALAAGYFNPLTSPISQSTFPLSLLNGGANNYDPFFTAGGQGAGFFTQMGGFMTNYAQIEIAPGVFVWVDIWEFAIIQAYGCGPFTSQAEIDACIAQFRADDECNLDLIWINFRNAYFELRGSVYYLAQQAYASNPANGCSADIACIGSPAIGCEAYANKVSRFGNANASIGTSNTTFSYLINTPGAASTYFTQQFAAGCQQYAQQAADEWMTLLSGCDFVANTVNVVALEADMVALISNGCNQDNPQGASTTAAGTTILSSNGNPISSLFDLLADYGLSESNLCTDLLISTPGPYQTAAAALSDIQKPLDICACDLILEAQLMVTTTFTLEEALAQLSGVELADANQLLCACEAVSKGTWYPGFEWPLSDPSPNDALAATGLTIPATLGCDECDVTCTMIAYDTEVLGTRFGLSWSDFSAVQNFETILTNYLNQTYDYSLAYEDYQTFIAQCGASEPDPYCQVNPLLTEWAEMMTLVAFRGQLLNDQTVEVDLLTENIVYEHSDLNGYFQGHNYWSSQTGNTLTTHIGTTGNDCTIDLTTDLDFADIVGFGVVLPLTNACSGNNTFQIEVRYIDCGVIKTKLIDGTSNCFEAVECICDPTTLTLCDDFEQIYTGPCYQPRLDELYQNAMEAFEQGVTDEYAAFQVEYNEQCAQAFNTENFNYSGIFRQYQFTLFYYDQAGNLVKTVAPLGVNELPGSLTSAITTARDGVVDSQNTSNPPAVLPAHTFKTIYAYNSYNQLVSTTNPDQEGDTKFWYDFYGRIVASQNPVQAQESKYSYSFYDPQGRPIQVGQVVQLAPLTDLTVKLNDFGAAFTSWVTAGSLSEVTLTQYDRPMGPLIEAMFETGEQENLRLRVASVIYYPILNASLYGNYESATHYSYDIHGNVKEQIQDVPQLAVIAQNLKSTQYEYELISGNVKKVSYQKAERDYVSHEYEYDALNRLTEVFTSTDDIHKTREAHYYYYDYGPLARTELGQYKVQGQDFAYTINGWLKGMNSSALNVSHDIGKDGYLGYLSGNTNGHSRVAKDVNAYTIGYFDGDYSSIGASAMEMTRSVGDAFTMQGNELYNGNIRHLVTSIYGMETMGTVYSYDQLQRLTEMTAFYANETSNSWSGVGSTQDYFNSYSYDKNGNILTLKRNGYGNRLSMDDMVYHYGTVQGAPSNQLNRVVDNGIDYRTDPLSPLVNDFGDIISGVDQNTNVYASLIEANNNFKYDKIGQLEEDLSEGIESIEWRKGDKKMKAMTRTIGSSMPDLEFVYSPFGLRILKIEKTKNASGALNPQEDWNRSYYSYDANGQCMAVYDLEISATSNKATLEEHHIYGASRLGMIQQAEIVYNNGNILPLIKDVRQNTLGERRYELTNHLGNVQAVITDRILPSEGETIDLLTSTLFPTSVCGAAGTWNFTDASGVSIPTAYTVSDVNADGTADLVLSPLNGSNVYQANLTLQTIVDNQYTVNYTSADFGETQEHSARAFSCTGPPTLLASNGTITNPGGHSLTFTATSTSTSINWAVVAGSQGANAQFVLTNVAVEGAGNIFASAGEDFLQYEAVVVMTSDYYPFGMQMPRRQNVGITNNEEYRFGVQGGENDNEIKGKGNSVDLGCRMLDPRLGRFFTTDPYMNSYSFQSPYVYAGNTPIMAIDFAGLEKVPVTFTMTNARGKTKTITVIFDTDVAQAVKIKIGGIGRNFTFKSRYRNNKEGDRRNRSTLVILQSNFMDEINSEDERDVNKLFNSTRRGFNVLDLIKEALDQKGDISIEVIGNESIGGGRKFLSDGTSRDVFGWHKADGTTSVFYSRDNNGDEEWVIVHFDGSEETFSSSDEMEARWKDLEDEYSKKRAEFVESEIGDPNNDIDATSRSSMDDARANNLKSRGVQLSDPGKDPVGITIVFDFRNTTIDNDDDDSDKKSEPDVKYRSVRWL